MKELNLNEVKDVYGGFIAPHLICRNNGHYDTEGVCAKLLSYYGVLNFGKGEGFGEELHCWGRSSDFYDYYCVWSNPDVLY